jgi:cysteine-rich repeat protein
LDNCQFNECGDGWQYTTVSAGNSNPLEQCDDGNTSPNDFCVACATPTCGDGEINGNEGCDNGSLNGTAGNPCNATCQIISCSTRGGVPGNAAGSTPGRQAGNGEECDDGNANDNDQCRTNCLWNVCGDGAVYTATGPGDDFDQPLEECDDGLNNHNNKACLVSCQDADCGDGFEWFGSAEQCDDGNNVEDDECTNDCTEPACGDGVVQDGEVCDDGGTCAGGLLVDQGCDVDADCPTGAFLTCDTYCVGTSTPCTVDDDCDDNSPTCDNTCETQTYGTPNTVRCDAADDCPVAWPCMHVCNETSPPAGNQDCTQDSDCEYGLNDLPIQGACVDVDPVTAGVQGECKTQCVVNADCSGGATCETATGACEGTGDTCTADAQCVEDGTCGTTVERCSNDNSICTVDGDCAVDGICDTPSCGSAAGAGCNPNAACPGGTCNGATCVGGQRAGESCTGNEECPINSTCTDGANADACQNDDPDGLGPEVGLCAVPVCGDAILDDTESCEVDDLDNIIVRVGVVLAAGTTCNPTTCTLSTCGANAGVPQPGEECDDGNASDTDTCTNRCMSARCGDGILQTGEECDDGNATETDACTNACLWNRCGDGVRYDGTTPNAQTGATPQLCDAGALAANTLPGFSGILRFSRGMDDGDGYDDQPAFCNSSCQVVCDGTAAVGAGPFGSDCLMAAEAYSLAPYYPGATESYLDDAAYNLYELEWEDAEEYCDNLGIEARLVIFGTTAERDAANGQIDAINAVLAPDETLWWVGAEENDAVAPTNPPSFVWLDGTSAQGMFGTNEPSLANGVGCAATNDGLSPAGALSDEPCGNALAFFCEYAGPFPRVTAP